MIYNINFMLLETVWQVCSLFLHLLTNRKETCQRERQFNGVTVNQRLQCRGDFPRSLCLSWPDIYLFAA